MGNFTFQELSAESAPAQTLQTEEEQSLFGLIFPKLVSALTYGSSLGYEFLSTWSVSVGFNEDYSEMRHDYYDVCMQNSAGDRFNTGFKFTSVLRRVNEIK